MTVIQQFKYCTLVQEYSALAGIDVYRVMSLNNICLATDSRIMAAYRFCEWFEAKKEKQCPNVT